MAAMKDLEHVTHRRFAILLIIVGLVFAAGTYLSLPEVYKLWPALLLIAGIGFIGIFQKRRARGAMYLAAGEYLILCGATAFYCNFTSWGKLSHLWPVFIAFLSVVLLTIFLVRRRDRMLLFFGLVSLVLSLFFFFVFSVSSRLWWTIFILVGISILASARKK